MLPRVTSEKIFTFIYPQRTEWLKQSSCTFNEVPTRYSDGCKTTPGVGVMLYSYGKQISYSLDTYTTVFQAEVMAILVCIRMLSY